MGQEFSSRNDFSCTEIPITITKEKKTLDIFKEVDNDKPDK